MPTIITTDYANVVGTGAILSNKKVIQMEKSSSGTYKINCKVNGIPLKFIFDTGASVATMSLIDAHFMFKNGYLLDKDIVGSSYYTMADGTTLEGKEIVIRELEIDGLILSNVRAIIVGEMEAPLLLGQSALSKLGKIEIDYQRGTLTISK